MSKNNEKWDGNSNSNTSALLLAVMVAATAVLSGVACGPPGGPFASSDAGDMSDSGRRGDSGTRGDMTSAQSTQAGQCAQSNATSPPSAMPSPTTALLVSAEGQNPEQCGTHFPQFDPAVNDPFEEHRYQTLPVDMIPPFEACVVALDELESSRSACDEVSDRETFLVSQQGGTDSRWQQGSFDAWYSTIQDAIDAADHCDTIIVRPGIYREYLRIEGKDVQIFSDTWNEDATSNDGEERVDDYVAERIDLLAYYETGARTVVETREPYLQPLRRSVRTILEGGGYAEGPDLGGTTSLTHGDPDDPDVGCGNRRPMVDFVAGTTRNTIFDGFTVRLMPEQDHTIPGHGHTLQMRGGSPIVVNNIMYNNGSTGAGVHASWLETTPLSPSCEFAPSLEQETFSNSDYRHSNVEYRPVPLIYNNISYQNNGLGLGNNHYSCAVMVNNEVFWNAVPGEEDSHQSPGIGTRHGAKTYLEYNIVYENAWTGIGVRQGYLQPKDACEADPQTCNHIDERTQSVILHNIVFANGSDDAPEDSVGGIGVDGAGLPDEPVLIEGNIVFESRVSGIGARNEYAGEDRGFVMDDTYVVILGNTVFSNTLQGIACRGSDIGTSHCTIVGNNSYWNHMTGIGFTDDASGSALNNVAACNSRAGIQTTSVSGADVSIYNNIAWFNVLAGIMDPGSSHDFNVLSGNNGQDAVCQEEPAGNPCINPQLGGGEGTGPGPNDLFFDPYFCDALQYDYSLRDGSPALDSGMDVSFYYSAWPANGFGPDRGSHER